MQTLKEDVREKIIDSAKNEFLEKGIERASMRDIAAGSGMTVGNLYRYFKNKEELNNISKYIIFGNKLNNLLPLVFVY